MRDKNERLLRRIIIDFEDAVKEMAIYKDRWLSEAYSLELHPNADEMFIEVTARPAGG